MVRRNEIPNDWRTPKTVMRPPKNKERKETDKPTLKEHPSKTITPTNNGYKPITSVCTIRQLGIQETLRDNFFIRCEGLREIKGKH